jgi:hypothetical protein
MTFARTCVGGQVVLSLASAECTVTQPIATAWLGSCFPSDSVSQSLSLGCACSEAAAAAAQITYRVFEGPTACEGEHVDYLVSPGQCYPLSTDVSQRMDVSGPCVAGTLLTVTTFPTADCSGVPLLLEDHSVGTCFSHLGSNVGLTCTCSNVTLAPIQGKPFVPCIGAGPSCPTPLRCAAPAPRCSLIFWRGGHRCCGRQTCAGFPLSRTAATTRPLRACSLQR